MSYLDPAQPNDTSSLAAFLQQNQQQFDPSQLWKAKWGIGLDADGPLSGLAGFFGGTGGIGTATNALDFGSNILGFANDLQMFGKQKQAIDSNLATAKVQRDLLSNRLQQNRSNQEIMRSLAGG